MSDTIYKVETTRDNRKYLVVEWTIYDDAPARRGEVVFEHLLAQVAQQTADEKNGALLYGTQSLDGGRSQGG